MRFRRKTKLISVIVAVFYIGGLLGAIDAVMKTRTAPGAIAWSVSLVTFPFVALPAYLVLGRSKFEGMAQAFEENEKEFKHIDDLFHRNMAPWVIADDNQPSVYQSLRKLSKMELTHSNQVELLIDGDETFTSILEGISKAEKYVLFQFYMIHDDELGRQVQAALIERAKAGVRVYVLYDEIGSSGLTDSYIDQLKESGAKVSSFKPSQGSGNEFQLNFRNHRKMMVVDGLKAWVGGHNVGDEYMGRDPKLGHWRDTHVKLVGPVALQLQATILGDWYWATRDIPELNWQPVAGVEQDKGVSAMIVPFSPASKYETASLFFVTALNSAKERIWLSAPYFVPDEGVMKALQLASLRGVDVRVITTGTPDSWPVFLAGLNYIYQFKDFDIKFYSYNEGFLHEKVMLIDDSLSTVGTPNFDNRSFRLNFEVTSLIADSAFNQQMTEMFEADFAKSDVINPEDFESKPFWWRLLAKLSSLASPVL